MLKISVQILLILFSLTGTLFSLDWQTALGTDLQFVSKTNISESTQVKLMDPMGFPISIRYDSTPTAEMLNNIQNNRKSISSIDGLALTSLQFIILDKSMDIHARINTFKCDGQEVSAYLPSGLMFSYSDVFQYNFRMDINNVFLKIKGEFINGAELCEKISEAMKDPRLFARKRDPEYILMKLDQLEEKSIKVQNENNRLKKHLINQAGIVSDEDVAFVIKMKKDTPSLDADAIRVKTKELGKKLTKKQIETILQIYFD